MRCPKCQYISFDSSERCRNCGYDFSLSDDIDSVGEPVELPIHEGHEPIGPLSDFALNDLGPSTTSADEEVDRPLTARPEAAARQHGPRPITSSFDLPLFKDRAAKEDAPLVTPGAAPRAPLAVRKATVAATRPRPKREDPNPRLALETAEISIVPERSEPALSPEAIESPIAQAGTPASRISRVGAFTIDALILGPIDAAVLYFTLKICELPFSQIRALPLVPFTAFLLLMNGGYFAAFVAAGGQTIGKMAAGIRVVQGHDPIDRVSFGHAIVRAAGYLVSALPAGLGFLPALFGDRRALHDRLADTRVVRA